MRKGKLGLLTTYMGEALEETGKKTHGSKKNYVSKGQLFCKTQIRWMRWQRRPGLSTWSEIVHLHFQLRLLQVTSNRAPGAQVDPQGLGCTGPWTSSSVPSAHILGFPPTPGAGPLPAVCGSRSQSHRTSWYLSEHSSAEGHRTAVGRACAWGHWLWSCLVVLLWTNYCPFQTLVFSQTKGR